MRYKTFSGDPTHASIAPTLTAGPIALKTLWHCLAIALCSWLLVLPTSAADRDDFSVAEWKRKILHEEFIRREIYEDFLNSLTIMSVPSERAITGKQNIETAVKKWNENIHYHVVSKLSPIDISPIISEIQPYVTINVEKYKKSHPLNLLIVDISEIQNADAILNIISDENILPKNRAWLAKNLQTIFRFAQATAQLTRQKPCFQSHNITKTDFHQFSVMTISREHHNDFVCVRASMLKILGVQYLNTKRFRSIFDGISMHFSNLDLIYLYLLYNSPIKSGMARTLADRALQPDFLPIIGRLP